MKTIKVLSLFDGISVAQQALKELGYDVEYYASEIDKYAIQLTQKNHPNTIQMGSVTDIIGGSSNRGIQVGVVDLLIGGSPCQDLSIAKKNRQGLDGARSGLFWEYVRILKEVKPKYFVLENVNSMPKEAKAIITEALGVEPIMINAALVSAQNRKRLFWTNIPNVTLPEDRNILLKDILQPPGEVDDRMVMNGKAFSVTASYNGAVAWNSIERKQRTMVRVGQIGKGGQADRIYSPDGKSVGLSALGGGRGAKTGLYAVAVASRGRNIVDGKRKDILGAKTEQRMEFGGDKANTITSVFKDSMVAIVPEATKRGAKTGLYAISATGDLNNRRMSIKKDNKSYCLAANPASDVQPRVVDMETSIIRKLTPIECERLQSLPDNYTEGVSNSQRYKALGNAFNCAVVKHILKNMK